MAYEKWMNVEGHARQIPLISFQQDGGMRVVLKLLFFMQVGPDSQVVVCKTK